MKLKTYLGMARVVSLAVRRGASVRAERFVGPPSVQRMHVTTEAVIFAQRTSAPW